MEFKKIKESEIGQVAKRILSELEKCGTNILLLKGDLGAGKTTLVKKIGEKLEIKENITSPTFVYMKAYKTKNPKFKKLVHIDAYRLENKDILKLDFKDKEILFAFEWPDKLSLKEKALVVEILDSDSFDLRDYKISCS